MIASLTERTEFVLQDTYDTLYALLGYFGGSYIAGGAIASLILGEKPNDYDVWFETVEDWQKAVDAAKALYERTDPDKLNLGMITVLAETQHALTFQVRVGTLEGQVVQFVKSRCGEPDEVVEQFDFRHAQAYFLPAEPGGDGYELVYVGKNSEGFIREKVLVFDGVLDYPTHTLSRVPKFAKRGYKVPDSTLCQLILAIREADAELIGRDVRTVGERYDGGEQRGLRYAGMELMKPSPSTDDEEPADTGDCVEF